MAWKADLLAIRNVAEPKLLHRRFDARNRHGFA